MNENVIIHYSSVIKPASFMFPSRFSLNEEIMDSMLIMKAGLYLTSSLWQLDESVFSCSLFLLDTSAHAVRKKVCSSTPEPSMTLKISVYKFKAFSKLVLFNNPQLHIYTKDLLCSPCGTRGTIFQPPVPRDGPCGEEQCLWKDLESCGVRLQSASL